MQSLTLYSATFRYISNRDKYLSFFNCFLVTSMSRLLRSLSRSLLCRCWLAVLLTCYILWDSVFTPPRIRPALMLHSIGLGNSYFQVGSRGACRNLEIRLPTFNGTIFPTGKLVNTKLVNTSFRAQWNAALGQPVYLFRMGIMWETCVKKLPNRDQNTITSCVWTCLVGWMAGQASCHLCPLILQCFDSVGWVRQKIF